MHRYLSMLALAALAWAPAGCFFDGEGPEVVVVEEPTGLVTVTWSIAGQQDPSLCDAHGAYDMEIAVYDAAGRFVTERQAPCDAFAVTLVLPQGTYSADATLVDPTDRAVSVTLPLEDIVIIADTEVAIDTDFPETSML